MTIISQNETLCQEKPKPTAAELTLSYPVISSLLDVVLDEIERHQERIAHLEKVKARLERLIPVEEASDEQTG